MCLLVNSLSLELILNSKFNSPIKTSPLIYLFHLCPFTPAPGCRAGAAGGAEDVDDAAGAGAAGAGDAGEAAGASSLIGACSLLPTELLAKLAHPGFPGVDLMLPH